MEEAQIGFTNLTAVVFGKGPGSFTGLRTACSVAQGLAFGANAPVLPIDTLLAVAEEARFQIAQQHTQNSAQHCEDVQRFFVAMDAHLGWWRQVVAIGVARDHAIDGRSTDTFYRPHGGSVW